MGVGLITETVKLIGHIFKKTPKKDRQVRNAGVIVAGAAGASYALPDELSSILPEPWTTIIRGSLMVIGGVVALLAQSQVEKNETEEKPKGNE